MKRCPGQDQRFWKPEDIFEIECPACGTFVEFWKDEPQVKCPSCKEPITNPRLDLGCAKWCQYAEECLGMINKQEHTVLSNKLIECLRQIAGSNRSIIRDSLEILRYAERILVNEGGDPLVVKASAIFSQVHNRDMQDVSNNSGESAAANEEVNISNILTTYGIDSESIKQICCVLDACQSGKSINSLEFNIIWDSCQLAQLHHRAADNDKTAVNISWKTETGRQLAEEMPEQ